MMGRSSQDQGQLFYSFNLEAVVPDDHLCAASRAFSIFHGSGLNWRRTILILDDLRSIRF
jgi:hypothetical protein